MTRFAHMVVLTAFLAVGFGVPMTFASEPAPAEQKDQKDQKGQKEKKDTTSSKADDEKKKDEKKDMGGK